MTKQSCIRYYMYEAFHLIVKKWLDMFSEAVLAVQKTNFDTIMLVKH